MSVRFNKQLFGGCFVAIACAMVLLPFAAYAQNFTRQSLHGHVPAAVSRLTPIGRLPATQRLNLVIGLPLRNEGALTNLIEEIYDPASPSYHHYLTPEQFTEQFGPTEEGYKTVLAFAKRNGLTVTATSANRVLVNVSAPVANIEKAFQVTMRTYRHPAGNRTFYAPDAEPSVEVGVPVLDVSGLNNYALPHPRNLKIMPQDQPASMFPQTGSAPGGGYIGNDFRAAYVPDTTLRGSGQMVGLLEFDGYYANDITNYEGLAGITNVPLQNVLLDSVSGTPGYSGVDNAVAEVSLDIEMAVAMAPALSKVVVFEGATIPPNSILNAMASSNSIEQFSCSWGWGGGPNATTDNIFKQMAAQGQSFFSASGDSDAFTTGASSVNGVDNTSSNNAPSSCPYITQVGGTTLTTTGAGGSWSSETVWNRGNQGGNYGSSGGISSYYPIPSWQTNVSMASNGGSASFRNIPDVALTAENVYVRYNNGGLSHSFGGTSCAAPLWAGFTALVNQQSAAFGRSSVGFINPAIYAIGASANYTADFHDITTGDNTWPSSPTNFYAVPGYDLCTGWGTPNGINLISALATPDTFGILPGTGFNAIGPVGGPFNATTQIFSLTNSGASSLTWSLYGIPSWLDVSSTGGALAAGGSTTVTVSLNSVGSNMLAGVYTTNLTFTNLTSGIPQSRLFTLQLGQSLVQNGGFETGDFSFWSLSAGASIYNTVVSSSDYSYLGYFVHSGTYGAFLGQAESLAYLSQTLPTIPGQTYLLSFWLENPDAVFWGGVTPNQFVVNWNTNSPGVNTIFNTNNMAALDTWSNMTFIVTATGTNTTLQFGNRNDPAAFGLDDINLWPIPTPSFRSISKSTNAITFTWNSLTSIVYQVEYSTNLASTNWTILSTNTATGFTVSITNSVRSDPQRFYRIRRLP